MQVMQELGSFVKHPTACGWSSECIPPNVGPPSQVPASGSAPEQSYVMGALDWAQACAWESQPHVSAAEATSTTTLPHIVQA